MMRRKTPTWTERDSRNLAEVTRRFRIECAKYKRQHPEAVLPPDSLQILRRINEDVSNGR